MTRSMFPFLAVVVLACVHDARGASDWPTKPVHIIVPGSTGGVVDMRARWLATRMSADIGQPVIVENRPGAGGNIGTEAGAKSAADGYTLVMVHQGTLAANPHMYKSLRYDPLRDLQPLTRIGYGPLMLAVNSASPVHSVDELVSLARTRRLTYGTPGVGTPPHLAVELFLRSRGIEATHIPYNGGGKAVSDLMGGVTDFEIEGLTVLYPQVKAGRLRALAITSEERSATCPEVPTMRESGVPGYAFYGWVGIALPAGTPPSVAQRVYEAVARAMRTPEAREWFATFAANPDPDTPEQFARVIRDDYERLGNVIRAAAIQPE
jgi:tripartite-type tricarboxylate transporter receptor subunit TctC